MKNVFHFTLLVCFFVCACNKEYKYVPYDKNAELLIPITFDAASDSAAYNHALMLYTFSIGDAFCSSNNVDYPHGFFLMDSENKVVPIDSKKKEKWTNERLIMAFGDEAPKVDYEKNMQLVQYFDLVTDKFDKDGITWYFPKSKLSCQRSLNNYPLSVYLYFGETNKKLTPLRIFFSYKAYSVSSWLFIQKMIFKVNGTIIEYTPDKVKTDKSTYSTIMTEEIDELVTNPTRKLINELLTANTVEVKLIGRNDYVVKTLCEKDIINIRRTVELYKAMGGFYVTKYEK